jgi:hypothetical protein
MLLLLLVELTTEEALADGGGSLDGTKREDETASTHPPHPHCQSSFHFTCLAVAVAVVADEAFVPFHPF